MLKNEPQTRQDQTELLDQYRQIGPAVLVAALMSNTKRHSEAARDDRIHRSILAVKKTR